MKRLRRWLLRIALLAAMVAALLSLVVGLVAEKQLPGALALGLGSAPWTLKTERFERGWWTSRVTVVAETAAGDSVWRYQERLSHGPWVTGLNRLGWIGGRGSLMTPAGAHLAELTWRLTPGLELEGQLDFSPPGLPDGRIEFTAGERFSRVDFRVHGLTYTVADTAGIDGLDGSGSGALNDGRIDARLELSARRGFWPGVIVDGPRLAIAVDQVGELLSLRVTASVSHTAVDQSYRDGGAEVLVERLHRPAVERLLDSMAGVIEAGLPPGMRDRQLAELLLLGVPELLRHQPRVELQRLRMDAPQGEFSGRAAIALLKPPPAGYLAEPGALIPALEAAWQLELPATLARRWLRRYWRARGVPSGQVAAAAEEVLARLRVAGLTVVEGKRLASRGSLKEELLTVNGQPRSVADWQQAAEER